MYMLSACSWAHLTLQLWVICVGSSWALVFGAGYCKPSLSLRKFSALKKFTCCSWKVLEGFEMGVHLCYYYNNNNNDNNALFPCSTGRIRRRQRWPQQQDPQASAEHLPCPSCQTHESWSAGRWVTKSAPCWFDTQTRTELKGEPKSCLLVWSFLCKEILCRNYFIVENHLLYFALKN